jgi:UDP-2-acetamido-3-amino-2,3-dideoxy-glucuronate N-acetyltransferase
VCGTTLGRYAFVGAGAVVTHDVAAFALVVGVPARQVGWMCRCGVRLAALDRCDACGRAYRLAGDQLEEAT